MTVRIIQGDALTALRTLESESVNCCVTSPPYWGLRDYARCGCATKAALEPDPNCPECLGTGEIKEAKQQLGLERTPDEYVGKLVAIFDEVRRVLTDDGTLWLNLGDCYNAYNAGAGPGSGFSRDAACTTQRPKLESGYGLRVKNAATKQATNRASDFAAPHRTAVRGRKPKDLIGIPWMVAFNLQAAGWYLRQDIIWHKPNPMPESVTDRFTKAHEYIFLLSKSERYYFNQSAILEPATYAGCDRGGSTQRYEQNSAGMDNKQYESRNKRSVWSVNPKPYKAAHFATYPPELITPCVLAGCPEGGTVLDPFLGSGTTAMVAENNGCNCIGIELNPAYVKLAKKRLQQRTLLA